MEGIAEAVNGATLSIVEQVLEEYGDPGAHAVADDTAVTDGVDNMEPGAPIDEPDDEQPSSEPRETSTDADEHAAADSNETTAGDESVGGADTDATVEPASVDVDESKPGETDASSKAGESVDDEPAPTTDTAIQPAALTAKQRETLREIARQPTATQATLADKLGVTSATISQRVNSIEGFDWSDRRAFVDGLFDDDDLEETPAAGSQDETNSDETRTEAHTHEHPEPSTETAQPMQADDSDEEPQSVTDREQYTSADEHHQHPPHSLEALTELTEQLEALEDHLERLEERCLALESQSESTDSHVATESGLLSEPELTHKVLHACLRADTISEEEELRLLKLLTASGTESE
ncbi:winged helix-turn-helix transcriptional regulator [Natronolimnobius sp. AArcel1]|nr:winged helix-turn-helix transcriptional regulator [Natronolimnobius sp. AArcel1]